MTPAAIWHSLDEVPAEVGGTVVTIGNFDGVHLGHQQVLGQVARQADTRGLEPVALTFHPHPRHVMGTPGEPPLLTGYEERNRLLLLAGMRGVLDLPFTKDFAQYGPEEFVRVFLHEGLSAHCVVLGEDSRFGRANLGTIDTMRTLARELDFTALTVGDLGLGELRRVSSSAIREALLAGDVARANGMLGRFHTVSDTVRHGFQRGRTLGIPTANLGPVPDGLVPADGVYAGFLTVLEQAPENRHTPLVAGAPATISIGTNPTFRVHEDDPAPRMVEAYVHDAPHLELYGDRVRLEFVDRQRPTVRFDSAEELVEQMEKDKVVTRRTLDGLDPQARELD